MAVLGSNNTTIATAEQLYIDNGTVSSCGDTNYDLNGTNICGDVLLLPIKKTNPFQFVSITTPHYLTLCEVEVFAGKD